MSVSKGLASCAFVFLSIFLSFYPSLKSQSLEADCDLLGENLKINKSLKTPVQCQKECRSHEKCRGFVFISGWNRCFLKRNISRKSSVQMVSASLGQKDNYGFDFSGKDIKQVSAKNPKFCRALCEKEKKCQGFTYIKGYSTCWLKRSGKVRGKIFFCGEKS